MTHTFTPDLRIGDDAPDGALPDGSRVSDARGRPIVLAFGPDEWDPSHVHESEMFARLLAEFGGTATDGIASDQWHAVDHRGPLAEAFGVGGRRAIFLLDEAGTVRWRFDVEAGRRVRSGDVLAALESLGARAGSTSIGTGIDGPSRRVFMLAAFAAAALLTLPTTGGAQTTPAATSPATGPATGPAGTGGGAAGTVPVTLDVNGQSHRLSLEPRVALLDALREALHLTGTKKGCDHGQCGACTVHVDGQSQLSCLTLAVMSQGKQITTVEGLASGDALHPLQAAFIERDAFQCGYCTPGQLMAATALLKDGRVRSDAEIREAMSGTLCRCAAYPNIIAAIRDVQGEAAQGT